NETITDINENKRRSQLLKYMNLNKSKHKIYGPILAEVPYMDDTSYKEISRTDLSFYPTQYGDSAIIFECKIVKRKPYDSVFTKQFYDEGLDRFNNKYDASFGFCGIIIFCENKTHSDVNNKTITLIKGNYIDKCKDYNKLYVYKYDYLKINDLYVLLLKY
ncbi:MAG: hypothetical protein RBQ78_05870, partial [Acholeplasmataceae bacterium]|nr:hypothetical protein [Acholeplasmataceae bacterium]